MRRDDLSILAEAISADAAILYANKRRELRGQPLLTKEEEDAYRPLSTRDLPDVVYLFSTKFKGRDKIPEWRAYSSRECREDQLLCEEPTAALAVYRLVKAGYTQIRMGVYIMTDVRDGAPATYLPMSKADIDEYIREAEEWYKTHEKDGPA